MQIKRLDLSSGTQFLESQYIYSNDEMMISAAKTFSVYETVLKAKRVYLSTDKIECTQCFVDSDELIIQTRSAAALYTVIKFTRDKNSRKPMVLAGSIDLAHANAGGGLVVLGAQSMAITFSPEVFK